MTSQSTIDNTSKIFGLRFRRRREALSLKQGTLAKRAEVSQSMLCHIEGGNGKLTLENFIRISKALEDDPVESLVRYIRGEDITSDVAPDTIVIKGVTYRKAKP